jgi:hypothetical protein
MAPQAALDGSSERRVSKSVETRRTPRITALGRRKTGGRERDRAPLAKAVLDRRPQFAKFVGRDAVGCVDREQSHAFGMRKARSLSRCSAGSADPAERGGGDGSRTHTERGDAVELDVRRFRIDPCADVDKMLLDEASTSGDSLSRPRRIVCGSRRARRRWAGSRRRPPAAGSAKGDRRRHGRRRSRRHAGWPVGRLLPGAAQRAG